MSEKSPRPNYYLEFLKSPAHAWIALGTLGLGFASPDTLGIGMMAGAALYALAWVYVPDLALFKGRIDRLREATELADARRDRENRAVARSTLECQLIPAGRKRYAIFSNICTEIQQALHVQERERGGIRSDEVAPQMDEFRLSFLKLLTAEQRLALAVGRESSEELERSLTEVNEGIAAVEAELARRRESGNFNSLATEERLLNSKREHARVLEARRERQREAAANLSLIQSELNRVMDRVKLMRADALAPTLDSNSVTSPLEETMEQLLQTNRWLADMESTMPAGSFAGSGTSASSFGSAKYTASGRLVPSPPPVPPPQREFGSLELSQPAPPPIQHAPRRRKEQE